MNGTGFLSQDLLFLIPGSKSEDFLIQENNAHGVITSEPAVDQTTKIQGDYQAALGSGRKPLRLCGFFCLLDLSLVKIPLGAHS